MSVTFGCTSVAGLDDLLFGAAISTGAAGAGGAGQGGAQVGGQGGVPSVPLADWSGAMLALYDFEDPADPTVDGSGNGNQLTTLMNPSVHDTDPPEGQHAITVDSVAGIGFSSASTAFESPSGTTFTFGGWFQTNFIYTEPVGRASDAPDLGYSVGRGDTHSAMCFVADGAWKNVAGQGTWPDFMWTHVVCRFDHATQFLSGFANGNTFGGALQFDVLDAARDFELPSFDDGYRYAGQIDEVFFVKAALSDEAIRRIWACGIGGSHCSCRLDDPSVYASCGRAEPSCSALPSCDAATP